ncbi:MAG: SUF system Fe-S cluster assembly regulator [Gammaproteobacteria bacterium]|nr:SUF system Fe-S cluster assembly regulator [Gammaproteobacteria bacterium]NNC97444.1 SUF system Fe-S cluster assembly regulator [Gammaproteobacteria bacterium]NNM13917.1 SUF system Fe-S cluster assembly regulator [Gammaproteobacteria bacterium]
MLKISKLTDYGTLVLSTMAAAPDTQFSASELAKQLGLSNSIVSKILKLLSRADLLNSHRGAHGGYLLAHPVENINALDIIRALEGPVALTECSTDHNDCEIAAVCKMQSKWQVINLAIRRALSELTLADLSKPIPKKMNIDLINALSVFNSSTTDNALENAS